MISKNKILVVEDLSSIRNFICDTLNSKGYEPIGVENGSEAYRLLTQERADINLVLTDYNMPNGNGFELLVKLKQNPKTSHVPIIFLTTESNPEKIRLARRAGVAAWIKKPFKAEVFFDEIAKCLFIDHVN